MAITVEQIIDIIQADLTVSGLLPKILPDIEIKRLIKEHSLEFFYKNYQFATQKVFYLLKPDFLQTEQFTKYQYLVLPTEFEGITRILYVDDTNLFRLGIQAPYLSINLGVTNQPFLTSFVTTAGELSVYRSIISYFSDEINKLTKQTVKHYFNHINKRLNFLTKLESKTMVLEAWVRIQEEELFDLQLFKDYSIGLSKAKMGEVIGRLNFNMPGNFQYNAADIIAQGEKLMDGVKEQIKGESTVAWFIMSR
jgi:hypothetical protein